ncbi:MAG: hypothetical protein LBE56_04945 [Tannerella sp.]|jgi:vacuolar-type H+-ATPase subunit I/STV1|nr:hypothetical protein [Tannerella sp.]
MTKNADATPESVWAILREMAERQAENERAFSERRAENERAASVRAKELEIIMDETSQKIKELAEQHAKTELAINKVAEQHAKTEDAIKKTAEQQAKNEQAINKLHETVGSVTYNNGSFAEEYFFNAFENGKRDFFGEKFDEIRKNVEGFYGGIEDEYDILLINGKSVGIVEVKYKAHENDIPKVLKKVETFRYLFPNFESCKVYLGLASMSFYPKLEQECIKEGIAVIKQVGDKVVIYDDHLKVF